MLVLVRITINTARIVVEVDRMNNKIHLRFKQI